jgi:hypothetical protein
MNREIKFRQFIGGKMQLWGFIDGAFFGPSSNGADAQNGQNTPQMQFTGLKDKNGKEIYEGDIVEFRRAYTNKSELMPFKEVVGFEGGRFTNLPWGEEKVEIIGNIYETPELLA